MIMIWRVRYNRELTQIFATQTIVVKRLRGPMKIWIDCIEENYERIKVMQISTQTKHISICLQLRFICKLFPVQFII